MKLPFTSLLFLLVLAPSLADAQGIASSCAAPTDTTPVCRALSISSLLMRRAQDIDAVWPGFWREPEEDSLALARRLA